MDSKKLSEYVGSKIREYRKMRDMTQKELGMALGLQANTISSYESGTNKPDQEGIFKIAKALDVKVDDLFPPITGIASNNEELTIKIKRVPMLGSIAAGEPVFADNHCEYYVEVNNDTPVDFCLKVKGDSMIGARIYEGDIVFVKKQPMVENGHIAVVLIDNEATLKRFYKNDGGVILKPENGKYQPKYYNEKDFKDIKILGRAVFFQGEVK
ncbi:MAG: helix-turn-helix domain-containing protein [Peptococcaceae bacterium]|nr:helix-turn-helix domain-containing protein [Peptococcaceae bacterium]